MSDKPAILVVQPHLAAIAAMLEADFTVWRLWQGPPLEASATIGALVVAGEFPIDRALAESLPRLGLIACFTAGYDGVDLAWASERGLKVSHSPGVNHDDVADHAMGLVLAAIRRIADGDRMVRAGSWKPSEKAITASLMYSGGAMGKRGMPWVRRGETPRQCGIRSSAPACTSSASARSRNSRAESLKSAVAWSSTLR